MMPRLDELDIPLRALVRLQDAGASTLEELEDWTAARLLALPGFGYRSLAEVRALMERHGLALRRETHKLSPGQQQQIAEWRASGATAQGLARVFGVSRQEIRRLTRPRASRPAEDPRLLPLRRAATTLQRHFLSAPDAARHLGIDKSHLCSLLRAGRFPGAFQFGGVWFVPKVSLEARRRQGPEGGG